MGQKNILTEIKGHTSIAHFLRLITKIPVTMAKIQNSAIGSPIIKLPIAKKAIAVMHCESPKNILIKPIRNPHLKLTAHASCRSNRLLVKRAKINGGIKSMKRFVSIEISFVSMKVNIS